MNEVDIEKILRYKQMKRDELIEIIINQEFDLINLRNKFDHVVSHLNCITNNYNGEKLWAK